MISRCSDRANDEKEKEFCYHKRNNFAQFIICKIVDKRNKLPCDLFYFLFFYLFCFLI